MRVMRLVRTRPAQSQRGLSLVELMVGIALGLFIVAGATMVVSTQLGDNRRLLLETQVNQDLRAAADIVTRELRRAGYWPLADQSVWTPTSNPQQSPYLDIAPTAGVSSQVDYRYRRDSGEDGPFGFKLEAQTLKSRFGAAGWQELTDPKTLRVTAFSVEPRNGPAIPLPCPNLCPDGTDDCWPTLTVREFVIDIAGEAVADPAVQRTLRTVVRLRNDALRFGVIPGQPGQACPL